MQLLPDEIVAETSTICDLSEDEEKLNSSDVISELEHNMKRAAANLVPIPKKKGSGTKVLLPSDKALFESISSEASKNSRKHNNRNNYNDTKGSNHSRIRR